MNIFYLDHDPELCAQYHTDKHVVKMILESAQLLCTALNVTAGTQVTPYKTTHVNHPCSIWTRDYFANWLYVYHLMVALEKEWQYRWDKVGRHKSVELLENIAIHGLPIVDYACSVLVTQGTRTFPVLAMPEHCKVLSDPVESYRNYYREEKVHLHKWTKRDQPSWL